MNKIEKRVIINKENKPEKTNIICFLINTDANNCFVFKGVGCGFVVNGKRHMTARIYVVTIMFIILK